MKPISVQEAQGQLGRLIEEAYRGEIIVLTDGDKQVTLNPGMAIDLEEDSPELEAELLKAANSPFATLQEGELREVADRALEKHRAKQQK